MHILGERIKVNDVETYVVCLQNELTFDPGLPLEFGYPAFNCRYFIQPPYAKLFNLPSISKEAEP